MAELAGFLNAIRDDPHDESVRLVFADWLEEQADPELAGRGEFVRLQCRLAAWVPDLQERTALQARERQLLERHRRAWLGGLQKRCGEVRFERGLAQITMNPGRFLRSPFRDTAAHLFRQAWVETVRLEPPLLNFASLAAAPHLAEVGSLDLGGTRLSDDQLALLVGSPHLDRLTRLSLANNHLTDRGLEALRESPLAGRFLRLDLRNNPSLTPTGIKSLLASPLGARLKFLDLHGNVHNLPAAQAVAEWQRQRQARLLAGPRGLPQRLTNSLGMELVLVPAGTFRMGSPPDEEGRRDEEGPVHAVTLSLPFYLGVYPVTQRQYEMVVGLNPSRFNRSVGGGPNYPVENVSWDDAQTFCQRLSDLAAEKAAARVYRLPTEAEWEHACRAGTTSPFSFGDPPPSSKVNYDGNNDYGGAGKGPFLQQTSAVGAYPPNAFGLYDMHGNVWEWCGDWYDGDYYGRSLALNPQGPAEGEGRVLRGGCWRCVGWYCRSAYRMGEAPQTRDNYTGFRVALEAG